jgi:hypothetical protein
MVTGYDFRQFRRDSGWSHERLAKALGLSESYVRKIETQSLRGFMPGLLPDHIAGRFCILREKVARRRPPSARIIARGDFCDRIIGQMRKIKRLCVDSGRTIVEIQSESPELDVWKLRDALPQEERDTFNHPRQWGPSVGFAAQMLGKHFDRNPQTVRDWVKASRAARRQPQTV